jgi:Ca2+-binding EF-hand superfamily protein
VRRRAGKKQRQRLKDVFATADVDNSGQIDLTFYLGSSVTVGPCEGSVLERLKDMDTDGDGKISKREWEAWFASSLALLSPQESDLVIDEIDGAVQEAAAVMRGTRMAQSAVEAQRQSAAERQSARQSAAERQSAAQRQSAAEGSTADLDGSSGEGTLLAITPRMSAARQSSVRELFEAWDVEAKGQIVSTKLQRYSVAQGPHKASVFDHLELMDANGDGVVSQNEFESYFETVSAKLSEDEFSDVVSEMFELAAQAKLVVELVALANDPYAETAICRRSEITPRISEIGESTESSPPESHLEELAPRVAPPLDDERKARVKALFDAYVLPGKKSIPVCELTSAKVKLGPHDSYILAQLAAMDLNQDGELTLDEMCTHFALLSQTLTMDEFNIIIDELMAVANMNLLGMKMLKY